MMKWWPTIAAILTAAASAFSTTAQDFWAHHPAVSAIVLSVLAIVAHISPQPQK